jgi:sigma-B regulation protein RsbU (phosphoserine phosphatase)
VIDPVDYQTRSVSLAEGDQLVLYTDGVTEAFNAAADMYGESRLRDLLAAPDRIDAASRVEQVFADVVAFAAGHPQSDDITVAVLNITSGN